MPPEKTLLIQPDISRKQYQRNNENPPFHDSFGRVFLLLYRVWPVIVKQKNGPAIRKGKAKVDFKKKAFQLAHFIISVSFCVGVSFPSVMTLVVMSWILCPCRILASLVHLVHLRYASQHLDGAQSCMCVTFVAPARPLDYQVWRVADAANAIEAQA